MTQLTEDLDSTNRSFGSGWISGFFGLALSLLGLFTVLCFSFPHLLTVEDARDIYAENLTLIRSILFVVLVAAFVLGLLSTILRKNKILGFATLFCVLLATSLGGSAASSREAFDSPVYLGLDFFVLNLMFFSAIFIPIERLLRKVDQPILRYEWREDLMYFLVSTMLVQILTFLSLAPSMSVLGATQWAGSYRELIASQPLALQFLEIMFLTDLVQYAFHRAFHQIPWLWKFHAVHHSAQKMDWIAGSRMHLLEVILLRAFTTLPMYVLGFAESALYAYILFVYLLSVFIHANLRIRFGWLGYIIATPKFHHWHHGVEQEAIDVNFAIHFPIIDMLFGTFFMPKRWPDGYGIEGHPVPQGMWRQFFYPFSRKRTDSDAETTSLTKE